MTALEELQAEYLGLFAYHLGIKPQDWDDMEPWHIYSLVRFVDQLEQQQ